MKTGRKKKLKSKPVKKKNTRAKSTKKHRVQRAKKPAIKQRVSSLSVEKRIRKEIYDVKLPNKFKTKQVLELYTDAVKLNFKKFPNDQVKFTLFASHGKEKGGMTYIYDLPKSSTKEKNAKVLKDSIKKMISDIFKVRPRQEAGYLKHAKIRDYINKITIDFETPD